MTRWTTEAPDALLSNPGRSELTSAASVSAPDSCRSRIRARISAFGWCNRKVPLQEQVLERAARLRMLEPETHFNTRLTQQGGNARMGQVAAIWRDIPQEAV